MTVEAATKVEDLNSSYPAAGDSKSEGDDHLRLIKATLLYTFAGAASTGVTGFNVVTQTLGNNSTFAASTAFVSAAVAAAAFVTALPSQSGNSGKYVTTDGTNASWAEIPPATGSTIFLQTNFGGL